MAVMCEAIAACVVCADCRSAGTSEEPKKSDGCAAASRAETRASNDASSKRVPGFRRRSPSVPRDCGSAAPSRPAAPFRLWRAPRRSRRNLTGPRWLGSRCETAHPCASGLRPKEGERPFEEDAAPQLVAQSGVLQRLGGLGQREQIGCALADVAGEDDALGAVLRDQRRGSFRLEEPGLQGEAGP